MQNENGRLSSLKLKTCDSLPTSTTRIKFSLIYSLGDARFLSVYVTQYIVDLRVCWCLACIVFTVHWKIHPSSQRCHWCKFQPIPHRHRPLLICTGANLGQHRIDHRRHKWFDSFNVIPEESFVHCHDLCVNNEVTSRQSLAVTWHSSAITWRILKIISLVP